MTIGLRRALAAAAALLTALYFVPAPGQAAGTLGLEQLMHELAQVKSSRGKFVERKYLAMLDTPLESSGTLAYAAPGRLEKHMLAPREESLILDGDTLIIENKRTGKRRSLTLQENPVVWGFAEGIRSTLNGDLATLRRFYKVALEGDFRAWRLRLEPTEPRMRQAAAEIRLGGSGTWVNRIEIFEAGGDRSETVITREPS
jgi:outer membrane lipoprotein-sorting protein